MSTGFGTKTQAPTSSSRDATVHGRCTAPTVPSARHARRTARFLTRGATPNKPTSISISAGRVPGRQTSHHGRMVSPTAPWSAGTSPGMSSVTTESHIARLSARRTRRALGCLRSGGSVSGSRDGSTHTHGVMQMSSHGVTHSRPTCESWQALTAPTTLAPRRLSDGRRSPPSHRPQTAKGSPMQRRERPSRSVSHVQPNGSTLGAPTAWHAVVTVSSCSRPMVRHPEERPEAYRHVAHFKWRNHTNQPTNHTNQPPETT